MDVNDVKKFLDFLENKYGYILILGEAKSTNASLMSNLPSEICIDWANQLICSLKDKDKEEDNLSLMH